MVLDEVVGDDSRRDTLSQRDGDEVVTSAVGIAGRHEGSAESGELAQARQVGLEGAEQLHSMARVYTVHRFFILGVGRSDGEGVETRGESKEAERASHARNFWISGSADRGFCCKPTFSRDSWSKGRRYSMEVTADNLRESPCP